MDNVAAASAGSSHSLAVKTDGTLWAWGENIFGQLGDGRVTVLIEAEDENDDYLVDNDRSRPVRIMNDVAAVSAGGSHSLAVKTDGSLWAWGWNAFGQLGNGAAGDRSKPVKIINEGVTAVSAGGSHSLALKEDGSLWAWGSNDYGQLGDGADNSGEPDDPDDADESWYTRNNRSKPVKIMDGVTAVSAGTGHSLAVTKYGSLWAWGWNRHGQLGDGATENKPSPVKIMDGVTAASAGYGHSLAVRSDGSLWGWGSNEYGQLGDGTWDDKLAPIKKIMDEVTAVSAGWSHNLAVADDGAVWAWGPNEYGQLGDGTTESRLMPVKITE